jgi:glycosyltransferase involved in cell wall biosynthesis
MSSSTPTPAGRPLRVLHTPVNIAGGPGNLSSGMRKLGVVSELWVKRERPFKRGSDRDLHLRPGGSLPTLALNLPKAAYAFGQALPHFDVFHFHSTALLLPKRVALPVLTGLGKSRVVQFWGSDIRDRPASAVDYLMRRVDVGIVGSFATRRRAPTGPWLEYRVLPPAIDTSLWRETPPNPDRTIRIVHAPSKRAKGTPAVIDAIATLKARGVPVELDMVENMPNAEARKHYEAADLIVDQLGISGWYGLFATESLSLGKPVICRIDPEPAAEHEEHFEIAIPIVSADPETLADVIRELVRDPERLGVIGRASREYAEKVHDCVAVARRCLDIYRDAGIDVRGQSTG